MSWKRCTSWAATKKTEPAATSIIGVELALDLEVGIVVASRDRGGRLARWFTNEIIRAV